MIALYIITCFFIFVKAERTGENKMKNINEMTQDEINAELNAYYELYYLGGLIEPDDLKEEPATPNSKNFIDVQPIKKNRKLTEEEQTDIINKLQSKTGTQWKHAFLGYFASENGQIYSLCLNNLLKLQKRKNSKKPDDFYFYFFASYHGNEKRVFVHQLINALFNDGVNYDGIGTFAGAYGSYASHHVNLNKTDNTPNNLIWVDDTSHKKLHQGLRHYTVKPDEINTLPNLKKWLAEETKQTEKHEYIKHLYDDFRND